MMPDGFDPNDYDRVPTLNAALTISLTRRLIAEMPAPIVDNPLTAVAADRMRTRAGVVRSERLKALTQPEMPNLRLIDLSEDNTWRALRLRLEGYAKLPLNDETKADSELAAGLLGQLFPNGLAFLVLDAQQQWEESDRLLVTIDEQKLAPHIDRLCHPVFLRELRRAHQQYGEALGLTGPKPKSPGAPAIAEALRGLREGIHFYVRRVVALADEEDPSSITLAQQALAPLLEAQEQARARRAQGQPDPEPEDEGEIPPLPTGVAGEP